MPDQRDFSGHMITIQACSYQGYIGLASEDLEGSGNAWIDL